jgi:hypothetical protein
LAKEKKPMPKMKRQDSRPRKRKNENYKENWTKSNGFTSYWCKIKGIKGRVS